MLKKSVLISINPEDFTLLGDSDAERSAQLSQLLNTNLCELMRFYKFIKEVRNLAPTPAANSHKGRPAKGAAAPKETPHLFNSINNE